MSDHPTPAPEGHYPPVIYLDRSTRRWYLPSEEDERGPIAQHGVRYEPTGTQPVIDPPGENQRAEAPRAPEAERPTGWIPTEKVVEFLADKPQPPLGGATPTGFAWGLATDLLAARKALDTLHGALFSERVYTAMRSKIEALESRARAAEEELERVRGQYYALIMEVGVKHPGESRHETALRYIRQAEVSDPNPKAASGAAHPTQGEELERVRDLTRAAMAYGDAGTTQRINALHRAAKAYYARRAGSQGEERT